MSTYETVQLKRIKEMAQRNRWAFLEEPSTKYCAKLITPKNIYFLIGAEIGINSSGASRVCGDKAYTQYFVESAGLKTIPTKIIYDEQPLFNENDFPLVVKPNLGWGGKGISLANNLNELNEAIQIAKKYCDVILVQKFIEMPEYRVLVFNDEVYFAYHRIRPAIIGDGRSSINNLIEKLIKEAKAKIDLDDERLLLRLKQLNLNLDSVLPAQQNIELLINANLSSGGKWVDRTDEVSMHFKEIALKAAKAMGLVMAGIDLFCENLTDTNDNYYIIEVNASPGLQYLQSSPQMTERFFADIEKYFRERG